MMVCSITSANVSMTANIIQISKNVVLVVVGKLLEVLPNNVDKINRQLVGGCLLVENFQKGK